MRFPVLPLTALSAALLLCACSPTSAFSPSAPLDRAGDRPAALRFGMHVTQDPDDNPIDPPERFAGYHAALDYETFAWEAESEVTVYAICSGEVLYNGFADGYGGLVTQRCALNGEQVTVLYGHLDGDGLVERGSVLSAGDQLGKLAPAQSHWSDGNRKHLHLGIRRGEVSDVRGYVQTEGELSAFLDPREVLGPWAAGRTVNEFHVPNMSK